MGDFHHELQVDGLARRCTVAKMCFWGMGSNGFFSTFLQSKKTQQKFLNTNKFFIRLEARIIAMSTHDGNLGTGCTALPKRHWGRQNVGVKTEGNFSMLFHEELLRVLMRSTKKVHLSGPLHDEDLRALNRLMQVVHPRLAW